MKTIDFVKLADGKSLDEAIEILQRLKKNHPDAKLVAQYEEDATFLNVEWPRVRKRRPMPTLFVTRRELTPEEKLAEKFESEVLFSSKHGWDHELGLAWWINNAGRI
jgi:hypothetical protein